VIGVCRKVLNGIIGYPVPSALTLVLLVLIGWGGNSAIRSLRASYHYRQAEQAIERRDFADAQAHLARCLEVRSNSAATHFLAARTARRAGNYDEAEQQLRDSLRLGEVPEAVDLERALLKAQRGDLAPVEGNLLFYVKENHPDTNLILEALAWGYMKTYQLPRAIYVLNLWLERQPDDPQALMWHAEASERRLSFLEAIEDYERVIAHHPDRDDARLRLAENLVQTHQPEAALPHLVYLREQQPDNPAILKDLARCKHLLNKPDEARQLLDLVLVASPTDAAALSERGRLAFEQGRLDEAERWLRKALTLTPYDKETTYALQQCLEQHGKKAEAAEVLKRLDHIEKELERLRDLTRQIGESPHDPALRHEAGMIFLRSGQAKEGLRWLASALQEDPQYAPTHQALVEYFESIGDKAQAARHRRWNGASPMEAARLPTARRP
jgi:tetratricopeptide (TPR) repeat protein